MGSKSSPPPPDYTAAANAQAQASKENTTAQTYANRANQYTPFGSDTWTQGQTVDPSTGQNVTTWNENTQLDPQLQASLNSQLAVQNARSDQAAALIPQMTQEYGQQMDWSNLPAWASAPQAGNLQATTNPYGMGVPQQNINTGLQQTPQLQSSLDFSGLTPVGNADQTRQAATNAVYNQAASRLDPQWSQQQETMQNQLANQGISKNSDAYTRAMGDFSRSKNDAYSSAMNNAVTQGGQQAQIDFGMNLQNNQNQASQIAQQGNFANQSATTAFGLGNTALNTQLGAQQAAYGEGLSSQQQQLAQQQQAFNQQQQAGAQNFGQQQSSATFENQLRNQQLTEAMQQRGFSLNEINALMSGQQVSTPTFNGYSQAGVAQTPDLLGAAQSQYGASLDASNASNAQSANTTQAVVGIASAAAIAF